jgi:hypothetical protein
VVVAEAVAEAVAAQVVAVALVPEPLRLSAAVAEDRVAWITRQLNSGTRRRLPGNKGARRKAQGASYFGPLVKGERSPQWQTGRA